MKKEKESASIPSEKSNLRSTNEITSISSPSIYRAANGETIDFHSAEFNRTDDLNDCSGSYRFFEPLDGIITADMRHQMDRLRDEGCIDAPTDKATTSNETKKEIDSDEPEPVEALPPLTVVSQGRTLIIDTDDERAIACGKILTDQLLTCTLVLTKKVAQETRMLFNRLTLIEADDVAISGAFCGFSVTVTANGEQTPLTGSFDLVLDLRPTPLFAGRRMPLGYYTPGANPEDIDRVLAELPEMRGRFKKPHFTAFVKSRCFHGRSRAIDCRRCVDVCPFGAIRSEGGGISINHYLCQGCGGCVLVCPADAIKQAHPPPEELLNILKGRLAGSEADASFPTTVVISDGGAAAAEAPSREGGTVDGLTVHFSVEEIGHIGLEMILTALSHGAGNVVIACDSGNPQGVTDAVARQAQMASTILKELDMPEDEVRFVVITPEDDDYVEAVLRADGPDMQFSNSPMPLFAASSVHDRRALVRLAVQHLYDKSGCKRPSLALPTGSPFGAVTVNHNTCTLCMACAAACPSGALTAGGDVPRLMFVESRCHQCGLCGETCPERSVQLIPRMMCDAAQIETPVVLCETEVSRCVKCNAPFASRQMVNHMTEKLKSHWMYANERQLQRLKMCRVCRTRDALASEDMRLWNR